MNCYLESFSKAGCSSVCEVEASRRWTSLLFYFFKIYVLFIYFRLRWVLVAACGIFPCSADFSLVVACSFLFSRCGTQASGRVGSVVMVHGL